MTSVLVFQGQDPRPTGMGREPVISGTVSPRALPRIVEEHAAVRLIGAPR